MCGIGLLLPHTTWSKTEPKAELGIGVGSFQTPHYLGSNHYYAATLPFPVVIYRFDFLEAGGDNRIFLFDGDSLEIDLAFSGRAPVNSDDEDEDAPKDAEDSKAVLSRLTNYTRRGMRNLPFTVFFGLQVRLYLNDFFVVELPYLTGNTFGSGFKHVGNTFSPTLRWEVLGQDSDHNLDFSVSWLHGNEDYNDFYYQVRDKDVLEDRSAFAPDQGLVALTYGVALGLELTERLDFGAGYFVHDLHQSIVRDSPLVLSPLSTSFVIGFSYSFFQSDETIEVH